jgi:UDP-glucose 4-epimerase
LLAGKRPVVYGDGHQSRDFTFVANVVDGNLLAADADSVAGRTLNLANGRSTTLLRLLELLNQLLGTDIEPVFDPPRAGDVRDSLADITAARTLLNFEPRVTFEEGLRRSIDYYTTPTGAETPAARWQ